MILPKVKLSEMTPVPVTTVVRHIAWAYAKCKYCDRQAFKVQGGKGLLVRFTCTDRGCKAENELVLP